VIQRSSSHLALNVLCAAAHRMFYVERGAMLRRLEFTSHAMLRFRVRDPAAV
jgi:hypothetical protein